MRFAQFATPKNPLPLTTLALAAAAAVLLADAVGCTEQPYARRKPTGAPDDPAARAVAAAFADAEGLRDVDVSASGKTVILEGVVPTSRVKAQATNLALKTAKGYDLDNRLRVDHLEKVSNDELRERILSAWKAAELDLTEGAITSHADGSITLRGHAPDRAVAEKAERLAKYVGATEVYNKIDIR
jgi:osmotically-inducible protein OsmY